MNSHRKRILIAIGTRPEAIKLAPVIRALKQSKTLEPFTVATAQHRGLMDQVLNFFGIHPDIDLNLMKHNQDLFHTTSSCLTELKSVLKETEPSMLIVQGDTTTAFASALAAFYCKIPVAHVEAGLRTHDKYSPFPEEINRKLITPLADLHFAPTEKAKHNLTQEGIKETNITVTGNTSIDALIWGSSLSVSPPQQLKHIPSETSLILLTLHRRENFGFPLESIFGAVKTFALSHPNIEVVYPVHPNPEVKNKAALLLKDVPNISLIDPVDYSEMLYLLNRSQFILTDSGGIQEEAPTLGKPVLVLRESTERPEAVESGCALLVGHHSELILRLMHSLCDSNSQIYRNMAQSANPFGNGDAAHKITSRIERFFRHQENHTSCAA